MKRIFTLMLLCAAMYQNLYSQGCTPIPPNPGSDCESAPFLCCGEVDDLEGTLPVGPNVNGPTPLCPNSSTVANNIEWVSFAAGATSFDLILNITNCTPGGGGNGAQVGIYTDCNYSQAIYCNGGQNMGMLTIPLTNMIIGEVYHLFIDGFSGAVCDYDFDDPGANTFAPTPQSPTSISGTMALCEGAPPQTYFAGLGANSSFNYWEITPGDVSFTDNGQSISVSDWGSAAGGTATICVEGLNDCYQNPTGANQACITVQVNLDQDDVAFGTYCQEEGGYVFPENGQTYQAGVHTVTVPNPSAGLGCDINYELTVEEFIPIDLDSNIVLCPGIPYLVNGTPFWPPIAGVQVPFGLDENNCLRMLNLTLGVVDTSVSIQANPTTVLSCDNPNILLTAIVDFDPQVTYTYEWDTDDGIIVGGAGGQNIIVNEPGTYSLNVTMETFDDRGEVICNSTPISITITEDTAGPDVSVTSQTPSSCGTTTDGTATVNPSGGDSPYSILWDVPAGSQSTPTATGLVPGTYSVTVTDASQCSSITQVEVLGTPVVTLDANPVITNVNCINELTGSATVSASGGTGTIIYTWDAAAGGQSGSVANGLGAGSYQVTASDDLGCIDILTVNITEPASAISGVIDNVIASACGLATGSIQITTSGGTSPYTFLWSDTSVSEDLTAASAGAYEVTITDNLGCEIILTSSIPNADGPSVDNIVVTNVSCNGDSDGSIDLQLMGGSAPFIFDWDSAPDVEDPTGLAAGIYNVLITDANSCTVTGTATITEPETLMASVNTTMSNCNQATGSLQLTVTGGSTIVTYDWDNAPDVEDPDNLPAGTYNVIVTDINGCVANASGTITEPDAPTGTSSQTDVSCNSAADGSVSINITSGGGGYQYDWGNPALDGNASNGGLAPGTYNVLVTDANNCTVSFSENVIEPTEITAIVTPEATLCFGQANGSATVVPSGGSGSGYTYQWCSSETSATATQLLSGMCTVTVTDGAGCQETFDTNIPEAVVLESSLVSVTPLSCYEDNSGAINIQVDGGTGSYTFDWTGGSIGNIEDPNGLAAGFYSVVITDDNNCETQLTNLEVIQPAELNVSATMDEASCNLPNGSIDVTVMGGTGTMDYNWTPALPNQPDHIGTIASGTYSVVVTDGNGCQETESIEVTEPDALEIVESQGSGLDCFGDTDGTVSVEISGGTGPGTYSYDWGSGYPNAPDLNGLAQGTYNVDIMDGNGCIISTSAVVTEPAELLVSLIDATDPSCQATDGSISIDIIGGTVAGDYNYDWNGGTYSTQNISGLGTGTYTVQVTDDNGCLAQDNYSIQAPDTFEPEESNIDVTCNNLDNGQINITIPDGSGDFTYDWSDSTIGDTPNASGLSPGMFDVVITDNITGCIESISSIEITEPLAINASSSTVIDATCLNNDGSIDATISGGVGGFTFSWSGPGPFNSSAEDISGLESGDYVLDILDGNNCPASLLVTVGIPDAPQLTADATDVLCNGSTDGTIQASVQNPNGMVTYSWSDSGIGDIDLATGLPPGNYDVMVTDDLNCTAEVLGVIVGEPTLIDIQSALFETDCDVPNGEIDLTVTGGVGGYTFDWMTLPDTEDQLGVPAGTYNVTVYDANNCPAETSVEITQPDVPLVSASPDDASCFQGMNGSINLDVTGTNGPYNFLWTGTSQTTEDPDNLSAGTYSVIVSDDDGCSTMVDNIIIGEGSEITSIAMVEPELCLQSNGGITMNVSGGQGPYIYNWSDATIPSIPDPSGLSNGNYDVTVEDALGCIYTEAFVVEAPDLVEFNLSQTDNLCQGDALGIANVNITAGVGPFTVQWDDVNIPDGVSASDLAVGQYTGLIIDGNGCDQNFSFNITEPSAIDIQWTATDAACGDNNGTIDLTVSGGAGGYTFAWDGGLPGTEDQSAVAQGNWIVTVTDANNCESSITVTVNQPNEASVDAVASPAICYQGSDGSIDLSVSGGNDINGYTFQWSGTSQTVEDPVGLSAGSYNVTVLDSDGCPTFYNDIIVGEGVEITSTATVDPELCEQSNGAIAVVISGGLAPYDYNWSDGTIPNIPDPSGLTDGNYSVTVVDAVGCIYEEAFVIDNPPAAVFNTIPTDNLCFGEALGSASVDITSGVGPYTVQWDDASIPDGTTASGLIAGQYTGMVIDANGCNQSFSVDITQPSAIDVQWNTTEAACDIDNGTIDLSISGGVGGYSFDWLDSTLPSTEDQLGVGPGNYPVTVYDANNCAFEITATVNQPNPADVSFVTSNIDCFGGNSGSIDLNVVGSNGPYNFLWSGTSQTVEDPQNLTAGVYAVTVFDLDGCETYLNDLNITEGSEVTVTADIAPALCNQSSGAIDLNVVGGTGPYSYDWEDTAVPDISNPTGLASGSYAVTVYDALLCPTIESFLVNDPEGVQFDQEQTDNLCFGDAGGTATVNINSGIGPFVVQWDDPSIPDGNSASNLSAGQYTGVVIDGNNCQQPFSFDIIQPATSLSAVSQNSQSISCFGFSDGTAVVQPSGGTGPYTYLWSTNDITEEISGLVANVPYTVTVTDVNNCTFETPAITLAQPDELEVTESFSDLGCNADNSGTISLAVSGGNGGYDFDWNQNQYDGLGQLSNLAAGTYTVNVFDVEGCDELLSITIDEPDAMDIGVEAISDYENFNVSCFGYSDGFVEISVDGGAGNYSFTWSTGETTQMIDNISAGSYLVTVTDANDCSQETQVQLTEPTSVEVDYEAIDVSCFGDTNGAVIITNAQGGSGPYVFGLDVSPLGVGVFNGLAPGEYELVSQDANGCEITSTLNIEEPDPLTVNLGEDIEIPFGDSAVLIPEIALGGAPLSILEWGNSDVLCPDGNCLSLNVKPLNSTTYRITVVDENGCTHEDNVVVRVRKDRNVYVPNVFNPQSDNPENSVFQLFTGRGVTMIEEFIVVDRWGEILYRIPEAFDPNISTVLWGWDGKLKDQPMNPGVYVYYAKVRFLDDEVLEYAGDVTLLR